MILNQEKYNKLSEYLANIQETIPLRWGRIQNDKFDNKLKIYNYDNLNDLNFALKEKSEEEKLYIKRRWFLQKCSLCDEYIFYSTEGVLKNKNYTSKDWDIEFFGNENLRFDIKSTRLPNNFSFRNCFNHPEILIDYYYKNQSKESRYGLQNRLFIVHHSAFKNREGFLRTSFKTKEKAVKKYISELSYNYFEKKSVNFINYYQEGKTALSNIVFIIEDLKKRIRYFYPKY